MASKLSTDLLLNWSVPQGFSNVNGGNFGGKGNKKPNAADGIGNGEQLAGLCAGRKISIPYGGHCHRTEIKAVNPRPTFLPMVKNSSPRYQNHQGNCHNSQFRIVEKGGKKRFYRSNQTFFWLQRYKAV